MFCIVMSMVDSPEDKRKVEKLYEKYHKLMYVVAYNILKHHEDAEDAVIESWKKIICHLDKINEIDCQETKSFFVIVVERTAILNDSKMDVKTYKDSADWSDTEADIIVRDFPVRLPKGFEKTAFEQSDTSLYAEWNKEGKEYIQYSRIILSDGMSLGMDGEYESKEKITICDYVGEYCVKGEESWIVWDDTTYNHMIISTKVEEPKELLLEMAESLYQ